MPATTPVGEAPSRRRRLLALMAGQVCLHGALAGLFWLMGGAVGAGSWAVRGLARPT